MNWSATTGINWPDGNGGEVRVEAGGEVPDVIVSANSWLVQDGHVVPRNWTASAIPVVEFVPDLAIAPPEKDHDDG